MSRDDQSGWRLERVRGLNRSSELTPDEIARLRRRVEDGFYASPRVANEIARRILERDDL